jgi:hypothetical protein
MHCFRSYIKIFNPFLIDLSTNWDSRIFCRWKSSFPEPFVEKAIFSSTHILGTLSKIKCCKCVGSSWGLLFYFIGHHVCFCASTMLLLLPWLCSITWSQALWYLQCSFFGSGLLWLFEVFCTFIWTLRLTFLYLWRMSLVFWEGLHWYMYIYIYTYIYIHTHIYIYMSFSQYWFHEHGMSFYLLMLSLISFFSDLLFSLYMSVTSFIKFIPRYFNVFEAFVDGIIFLTSFLDCSLFEYRNATEFCMLILYSATLLKVFMRSMCFLVEFFWVFQVKDHIIKK